MRRLWRATEGIRWLILIWLAVVAYLLLTVWSVWKS